MFNFLFSCLWKHEWVAFGDDDNGVAINWSGMIVLQCVKCGDSKEIPTRTTWLKKKHETGDTK